jgi:hypothetical protein
VNIERPPVEPVSDERLQSMIDLWKQKCVRERASVDMLMLDTVLALQELKTTRRVLKEATA